MYLLKQRNKTRFDIVKEDGSTLIKIYVLKHNIDLLELLYQVATVRGYYIEYNKHVYGDCSWVYIKDCYIKDNIESFKYENLRVSHKKGNNLWFKIHNIDWSSQLVFEDITLLPTVHLCYESHKILSIAVTDVKMYKVENLLNIFKETYIKLKKNVCIKIMKKDNHFFVKGNMKLLDIPSKHYFTGYAPKCHLIKYKPFKNITEVNKRK